MNALGPVSTRHETQRALAAVRGGVDTVLGGTFRAPKIIYEKVSLDTIIGEAKLSQSATLTSAITLPFNFPPLEK